MMRSDTDKRDATIAFDNRETRETPKGVAGITWAMLGVVALLAIIGAVLLGGFFSFGKHGYDERTYPGESRAQP